MGIGAGSAGICPHCQVNVRFEKVVFLAKDGTKLGPMGVLSEPVNDNGTLYGIN